MEYSKKSLIMCITPLQMLIAERIIESKPKEKFDIIVFSLEDNEKFKYYANRLSKYANKYWYACVGATGNLGNLINFIRFLVTIKFNGFNHAYDNYYLSSIDSRYFQYLISNKRQNSRIFTFDDGTANIIKTSIYFMNNLNDKKKAAIFKFLGIKYFHKDIINMSELHYTIYPEFDNIIEKKENIDLFRAYSGGGQKRNNIVNIFIGQPYNQLGMNLSLEQFNKILSDFNIDYYFPHPREGKIPYSINLISTDKIFEDYLIDYLSRNSNDMVNVYTFMSSAALNISSIDGVNVFFIKHKDLVKKYSDFFTLLEKHNFNLIKI